MRTRYKRVCYSRLLPHFSLPSSSKGLLRTDLQLVEDTGDSEILSPLLFYLLKLSIKSASLLGRGLQLSGQADLYCSFQQT